MYNLLIIDDDIYFVKNLVNILLYRIPQLRLVNIATNGVEACEYVYNKNIDIILLDLTIPKLSGIQVLEKIRKDAEFNNVKILVISGNLKKYNELVNYKVDGIYSKPVESDVIVESIKNIIDKLDNESVINKYQDIVFKELLSLKYNTNHNGTKYLKDCILYVIQQNDENLLDNLEKNLYQIVGKHYGKSVKNIKNNIVKATNSMYFECDMNYLLRYFGYSVDIKPTPKVVISTIVSKVIKRLNV